MINKSVNYIYSFYRFIKIKDKVEVKKYLDKILKKSQIKGTILLANEGINGSISGKEKQLLELLKLIRSYLRIKKYNLKVNQCAFIPFNRMKVRLKSEIVSFSKEKINVNKFKSNMVKPSAWNKLIEKKDVKVLDVRNIYEINIGTFNKSINPKTNSFRELPKKLRDLGLNKNDNIAMFCTGGIRCEKASAYLRLKGYNKVSQLEGGIINYLDYMKGKENKSLWKGECFVFDDRVTINKNLQKGRYLQCYGCRNPISKQELKSKHYIKGVQCQKCYKIRSDKQKKSSLSRQKQIDLNRSRHVKDTFQKII